MSGHVAVLDGVTRDRPARAGCLGLGLSVTGGSAVLASSPQLAAPGLPVPAMIQSLAAPAGGIVLGPRLRAVTVPVYLAGGASGPPEFANFLGMLAHLTGRTGGYLPSLLPATWLAGSLARARWDKGPVRPFLKYLFGHALIPGAGAAYLAFAIGPAAAVAIGLIPFLLGSVGKSMLGVALSEPPGRFFRA